jgi:hypothetical protein
MLDDRRQRHGQRPGELADRSRPAAQPVDHQPPSGIGEGLKEKIDLPVSGLASLKH